MYEAVNPRAASCLTVPGAISSLLTASAVRVSEGLKLRNGLPPFCAEAAGDASRTTEEADW